MKYNVKFIPFFSIIFFCNFLSVPLIGQFSAAMSIGNSSPLHQVSDHNVDPFDINHYNLDFAFVPKRIGFGLQLSTGSFETNESYLDQLENFDFQRSFTQETNKNRFLFLGPVLKFGKQKLNLKLFPKIGIGRISIPDRRFYIQQGQEQIIVYQDDLDNSTDNENQVFTGLDLKLGIGLIKNLSAHISAGINTNRFFGTGNTVVYREVLGNETESMDFVTRRLFELDCPSYEIFNIGVGLAISFPRNKRAKPVKGIPIDKKPSKEKPTKDNGMEVFPPIVQYPEDGSSISISSADSIQFEWRPETRKLKGTNYVLSLFKIIDSKDSLVFRKKIKKREEFDHTDEPSLLEGKYKWIVQAVDAGGIELCKEGCFSEESVFEVGGLFIPQFYNLLFNNSGSHVAVKNKLRFVVEPGLLHSENLKAEVIDEKQLSALPVIDLFKDNELVKREKENRFEIDISSLKSNDYFFLKVYNSDRTYFLRFYTGTLKSKKDGQ